MDEFDVSVRNPVKVISSEKYTVYEICLKTTNIAFALAHSITRRRFSEFIWLRKKLKEHHPQINPPPVPKKSYFGERFDPEFVAVRMKSLEDFLNSCFQERLYFSDSSLHLFVQSSLSCSQIEDYLHGTLHQEDLHAARIKCQKKLNETFWLERIDCPINRPDKPEPDPCSSPVEILQKLSEMDSLASSNDSVSNSLDNSIYLSCAIGPGSIQ